MATLIGKARMTVIRYENGGRPVTPEVAILLEDIFHVKAEFIVGYNQKIEISESEFRKVFSHYVRHKNDPIELKQTDFLKRKIKR